MPACTVCRAAGIGRRARARCGSWRKSERREVGAELTKLLAGGAQLPGFGWPILLLRSIESALLVRGKHAERRLNVCLCVGGGLDRELKLLRNGRTRSQGARREIVRELVWIQRMSFLVLRRTFGGERGRGNRIGRRGRRRITVALVASLRGGIEAARRRCGIHLELRGD